MLTVDPRTRPVWAKLLVVAAAVVVAATLVLWLAPKPNRPITNQPFEEVTH